MNLAISFLAINPILNQLNFVDKGVQIKFSDLIQNNNKISNPIISPPIQNSTANLYERYVIQIYSSDISGVSAPLNININPIYAVDPEERIVK